MHITATCSKAKQILSLLYRRFYGSASPDTLKQLYLSMTLSTYQITDPHLVKDKKILENVHKFVIYRLASHQWDSSDQDLLKLYQLQSLEECIGRT